MNDQEKDLLDKLREQRDEAAASAKRLDAAVQAMSGKGRRKRRRKKQPVAAPTPATSDAPTAEIPGGTLPRDTEPVTPE